MGYKVIRKMYRSVKDMESGKPYRTINITDGWAPLTKQEAEMVAKKVIQSPLWIHLVETV